MNQFLRDRKSLIARHLADVDPSATGVLFVDLSAIARNYRAIAGLCSTAECSGVVKANAYGLGLRAVASALANAGCATFFVATLAEAQSLRDQLPDARVYVLNGLLPGTASQFRNRGLRPVLNSLVEVQEWIAESRDTGEMGYAAVQFDTGMTRLGLTPKESATLAESTELTEATRPTLKMSHLACADEQRHEQNSMQLKAFRDVCSRHQGTASLANSAGTMLAGDYHFDLVRPGVALYGGRAVADVPNPMSPVVHLYGRILQIREIDATVHVGYGATHRVTGPRRLATVAAGYADGYFRHLSATHERSGASVLVGGCKAPVVGRISMDLTVVDVSRVPAEQVVRGGWAELIGFDMTVDDVADCAGTIGYEVLTRLGRRYRRIYLED